METIILEAQIIYEGKIFQILDKQLWYLPLPPACFKVTNTFYKDFARLFFCYPCAAIYNRLLNYEVSQLHLLVALKVGTFHHSGENIMKYMESFFFSLKYIQQMACSDHGGTTPSD